MPELSEKKGAVLVGVVFLMVMMLIIVPPMVKWVQQDSTISVKDSRTATAFNLAETAVERGMWKLKSTTTTWEEAATGISISGYSFDVEYTDVPGGKYRIGFSSSNESGTTVVTVWGEGRDDTLGEQRSIQVAYQNSTIPGAILSGGALEQSGMAIAHWGAIMAMNNITVSGSALNTHYPRKLSKQIVSPYDSSTDPPNTDNEEWWSSYDVPDLPEFDFAAMRSSAAATNTLNCNGAYQSSNGMVPCGSSCTNCVVYNVHNDNRYNSGYIWYWDNNVTLNRTGVRGSFIVRGNLTTQSYDYYGSANMDVPQMAFNEYIALDNSSTNQYPGDNGYQSVKSKYLLGSCGSTCEGSASGSDLGFWGFVYVGGNIDFSGDADIYGAIWVVGNWEADGNNMVFYDDSLDLPVLNVVLVRRSWKEVSPSGISWN